MTLASHLHTGALGKWFRAGPVDHGVVTDRVADALRGRVPLRSPRRSPASHGALVQATVRARLGLVVQHAPPYGALVGAHRLGLAAPREVHEFAARFPTHAPLDAGRRRTALGWRPVGDRWLDTGDPLAVAGPVPRRRDGRVGQVVDALLELLDDWAPPGRLADQTRERELAALCVVTAAWAAGIPAVLRHPTAPVSPVSPVRAGPVPPAAVVGEVADLVALACEAGILTRLHRCAGRPGAGVALGTADAVFVPGWAEGGTVLGRDDTGAGPTLLVDVMTAADPLRDAERLTGWCHDLLARAWLDVPELHGVTHVGLYLARHGVLVTWRVGELAAATGHAGEENDPARFLELARRVAAADGIGWRTASASIANNILCMA